VKSSKKLISLVLIAILSLNTVPAHGYSHQETSLCWGAVTALLAGAAHVCKWLSRDKTIRNEAGQIPSAVLAGAAGVVIGTGISSGLAVGLGLNQAYYAKNYGYSPAWGLVGASLGAAGIIYATIITPTHPSSSKEITFCWLALAAGCAVIPWLIDTKKPKPEPAKNKQ